MFKLNHIFFIFFALLLVCPGCISYVDKAKEEKTRLLEQELHYSRVVLFTLDSMIYNLPDTVFYVNGKPLFKSFLLGAAFIDSTGTPIHSHYRKYILTREQDQELKDSFLYDLHSGMACNCACTPIYRDVLMFYDSSGNVIEQAQISFGCGHPRIYPDRDFKHQEQSILNLKGLQQFIWDIKKSKPADNNQQTYDLIKKTSVTGGLKVASLY